MKPALTVLVVSYNHEATIAKALDSILEQETSWSYEIWICEDCSTDRTLAIAQEYAQRHPGKFKFFAQPSNTGGRHFYKTLCTVDTKYFTILESDDYWCDKGKIQMALDTLEANEEYLIFAHDTLVDNQIMGTRQTFKEFHGVEIRNPMTLYNSLYLHTSSRVHRNIFDLRQLNMGPGDFIGDFRIFMAFLDKGPLYYCDRVMSVYNITGSGEWSKLSPWKQSRATDREIIKINSLMDYRHEAHFTAKVGRPWFLKILKKLLGPNEGWKWYMLLCYLEKPPSVNPRSGPKS